MKPAQALSVVMFCSGLGYGGEAAERPEPPPLSPMVGGANAPAPSEPLPLVLATRVLSAATFQVKVPAGTYTAPKGGAKNYTVPGPIVAFKGVDGVWRGHGYLETYPKLLAFAGTLENRKAHLLYTFEGDASYEVTLTARDGVVLVDEHSRLGPRNLFVFDCYYGGWLPSSGFAVNLTGKNSAFVYLPCYYDKAEVTLNPVADLRLKTQGEKRREPIAIPGGVAVLNGAAATCDLAGFWCRDLASWRNGDRMGIQLWQRRQRPGDPASRHFLGPETKSDATPNPRTAGMLGTSLYEGHVTIECNLGRGTRKLGFAVTSKGTPKGRLPEPFMQCMQEHLK